MPASIHQVTHPMLPSSAAPGQLSVAEINQARALLGENLSALLHYLFLSLSLSFEFMKNYWVVAFHLVHIPLASASTSLYCVSCLSTGLCNVRNKLYLFGKGISKSPSPCMHNAGFNAIGAAYSYGLCDAESWEEALKVVKRVCHGHVRAIRFAKLCCLG